MQRNTNELTGATLDWAVATVENKKPAIHTVLETKLIYVKGLMAAAPQACLHYAPSNDWGQGGPIIERERIDVGCAGAESRWYGSCKGSVVYGPTPLVAAMRCYVASKLGYEVEVPEELSNVPQNNYLEN